MDFLSAGEFSAGSAGHRETEREELTRAHTQVLCASSTAVNTNIRNPPANTERSPADILFKLKNKMCVYRAQTFHILLSDMTHITEHIH